MPRKVRTESHRDPDSIEKKVMNREKWRNFRIALVVFALVASLSIYDQGGFDSLGLVGLSILLLAFAAVGFLLYNFVKDNPEDPFRY